MDNATEAADRVAPKKRRPTRRRQGPKKSLNKRYHHGDLRQALIDKTLKLLKKKPADQVSVADVARAVGVSSGAPYRHFKDRDALLAEVAAIGFDRLRERMEVEMAPYPLGEIDRVIAAGYAYIRFSAENPDLFDAMWGSARIKENYPVASEAGGLCYGSFIETLSRAMAAHGFGDRDPVAFGAPLWTMVHGYASLVIAGTKMLDSDPDAIRAQLSEATYAYFQGRRGPMTAEEKREPDQDPPL